MTAARLTGPATPALRPRRTRSTHGIALPYLDLDELTRCSADAARSTAGACATAAATTSATRRAAATPCAIVAKRNGRGRRAVRLLTQLRTLGPASTRSASTSASTLNGEAQAVVAEVTNTPWGERHAYVLRPSPAEAAASAAGAWRRRSRLAVPPRWTRVRLTAATPGRRCRVRIENRRAATRRSTRRSPAPPRDHGAPSPW